MAKTNGKSMSWAKMNVRKKTYLFLAQLGCFGIISYRLWLIWHNEYSHAHPIAFVIIGWVQVNVSVSITQACWLSMKSYRLFTE